MKKTFLKSVATGIVGLSLVGACSVFDKKDDANKCSSNGCKAKTTVEPVVTKTDSNSCSTNSCAAKKAPVKTSTHKAKTATLKAVDKK